MYERDEPVECVEGGHFGDYRPGDKGRVVFGTDYLPGWDAGQWTVEVNGKRCSYWTESEMLEHWRRT